MDIQEGLSLKILPIPFVLFSKTAGELTITHVFETIEGFLFAAYKQSPKL